jgi:hypothetical protein
MRTGEHGAEDELKREEKGVASAKLRRRLPN